MSRVDFAFGAPDRLRMACEVVRKHYEAGRQVVVYLSDARQRNALRNARGIALRNRIEFMPNAFAQRLGNVGTVARQVRSATEE